MCKDKMPYDGIELPNEPPHHRQDDRDICKEEPQEDKPFFINDTIDWNEIFPEN